MNCSCGKPANTVLCHACYMKIHATARAEADALRRELAEAREGLRAVMQADAEEADDYLDLGARFAEVAKERDALRAALREVLEAREFGEYTGACDAARALLADKEGM